MATSGSIRNIDYNITHAKLRVAKILHYICFSTEGEPRKTRKALRAFAGFRLDDTSEQFLSKCNDVSEKFDLPDLIAICKILDLNYKNEKHDVVFRICSFLNTFINDDETEDDEEEDDVLDIDEDDERRKEEKSQLEDEKRRLQEEKRRLEDERREDDERREKEKRRLEDERLEDDERREKEKRRLEEERRKDDERRAKDDKRLEEEERRRRERRNDELRRRREERNYDEGRQICDERRRYERSNDEERRRYEDRRYDEDIHVHEEIGERSSSASNNAEIRSANNGATGTRRQVSFALSFRDVEGSIRSFNGKDEYPIRTWIIEFEEVAEITGWNDLQKLIYAKNV
uniref:Vicilin-like seed storage protein At2g18540 n=1 Tax=Diabrotica virgifera virgifera TaxID=50390 RepID=A0A6P7GHW5_DIAVI